MAKLTENIEEVDKIFNDIENSIEKQYNDTSIISECTPPSKYAELIDNIPQKGINPEDFSAEATALSTGKPQAEVKLDDTGKFSFIFGIPEGKPGRDGLNGTNANGRVVFVFRSSEFTPKIPKGGIWDSNSNKLTSLPEDIDGNQWVEDPSKLEGIIWTSNAVFDNTGCKGWTTPFRLSGEKGEPGKDGTNIEFIYLRCKSYDEFIKIKNYLKELPLESPKDVDEFTPENKSGFGDQTWSDNPRGVDEVSNLIEITCNRIKKNDGWGVWSEPCIWAMFSKDGAPGVDGKPGADGKPGQDGEQGPRGGNGPILYPAGEWSINREPYKQDSAVPYVTYNGEYYILKDPESNNVSPDKSNAWTKFDKFEAIITNTLVAKNATVGGFAYNNNSLFSIKGNNDNYQNIKLTVDGGLDPESPFNPNIFLSSKEGSGQLAQGNIKWDNKGNGYIGGKNGIVWKENEITIKPSVKIESDLTSKSLITTPGENGAHTEIEGGMFHIYGKNGIANIRIGINKDGESILEYYDKNNKLVWSLQKTGIIYVTDQSKNPSWDKLYKHLINKDILNFDTLLNSKKSTLTSRMYSDLNGDQGTSYYKYNSGTNPNGEYIQPEYNNKYYSQENFDPQYYISGAFINSGTTQLVSSSEIESGNNNIPTAYENNLQLYTAHPSYNIPQDDWTYYYEHWENIEKLEPERAIYRSEIIFIENGQYVGSEILYIKGRLA